MDKGNARKCPSCRENSYFIVPSSEFYTGDEKEVRLNFRDFTSYHLQAVIQVYKDCLKQKPCKYFHGELQKCPFGANCFYGHFGEDGEDTKEQELINRFRSRRFYRFYRRDLEEDPTFDILDELAILESMLDTQ